MLTNARRFPTSVTPTQIARIQTDLTFAIVRLVTRATVKRAPKLVRTSPTRISTFYHFEKKNSSRTDCFIFIIRHMTNYFMQAFGFWNIINLSKASTYETMSKGLNGVEAGFCG